MKKNVIILFTFFLSCLSIGCKEKKTVQDDNNQMLGEKRLIVKDTICPDTIPIDFGNGIKLYWDVRNDKVVEDKMFLSLKKGSINKTIVNSISDTTNLHVHVRTKSGYLRKGDVAFILLNDLNQIALARDVSQFDYYDTPDCRFPCDMLNYLEMDRDVVKEKLLKRYFESSE